MTSYEWALFSFGSFNLSVVVLLAVWLLAFRR